MSFSTDLQWCPLRAEWKQALMNYFSVSMWEAQPHILPERPECWDGTLRGLTMLPPLHSAGSHQPPTSPAVGQAMPSMGRLRAAIGHIKHQPREHAPLLLLLPLQEQSFVCSNPAMLMAFYAEKTATASLWIHQKEQSALLHHFKNILLFYEPKTNTNTNEQDTTCHKIC